MQYGGSDDNNCDKTNDYKPKEFVICICAGTFNTMCMYMSFKPLTIKNCSHLLVVTIVCVEYAILVRRIKHLY